MRWNELGKFLIISLAIIGGFCVYISPLSNSIKQGLDLQGGTHVVLQAVDTPELNLRGRRAPQPAAAGRRRHLARQPSRGARHDGPFGRSGLRPEAYPRPLGRRRRSRRRADPRSPGRRRPHGRLLRRGLQTPAHRRAGGRRTPRR